MQRTNRSLVGQGSTTTLIYRELGVRWQAAGVMSAAALKVALSLQRKIIHRDHSPIWYRPPRALRSVREMHGSRRNGHNGRCNGWIPLALGLLLFTDPIVVLLLLLTVTTLFSA